MRSIVWLGSGMAALLLAIAAIVGLRGTAPPSGPAAPATVAVPAPPAPATPGAPSPQAQAPAPATMPAAPSFDIVRIDPQGHAVIAGRAEPGDRVRVLDGDKPIGEVTADARGEWVLLPDTPLAPGNRPLSLEATGRGGGPARRSADVVALSVLPPAAGKNAPSAVAVLLPGDADKPARVLQRLREGGALGLEGVEQTGDALAIAGYAGAGDRVEIYAGDRLLGAAVADRVGQWTLTAPYRLPPGGVELRVDELAADGAVVRHITAPLTPPPAPAHGDTYIVERGNSLWLIARQVYGQGMRYTAIYRANQDQIRDPNRIYPGQQFKMPKS